MSHSGDTFHLCFRAFREDGASHQAAAIRKTTLFNSSSYFPYFKSRNGFAFKACGKKKMCLQNFHFEVEVFKVRILRKKHDPCLRWSMALQQVTDCIQTCRRGEYCWRSNWASRRWRNLISFSKRAWISKILHKQTVYLLFCWRTVIWRVRRKIFGEDKGEK